MVTGLLCAILVTALITETTYGADKSANTSACKAIAKLATSSFVIKKAEIVPAGPAPMPDGQWPR